MDRKITMKDVAEAAGVSTATVGRVLHNRGYVSEESREQVEEAIQKTGFRLNLVAQSLRRSRTMTIGHLLTSLVPNPFFAGIEMGVEQEAIRQEYNVLLWNVLSDAKREREGVEMFIQRQVDAMIFTTPIDPENVELARRSGVPVIQVERPSRVETHQLLVDNYVGAVQAAEHLIGLGHERIAFIGRKIPEVVKRRDAVDLQRRAGWKDTLLKHGITPPAEWYLDANLYSVEEGFQAAQKFLALQPGITAIMAASDLVAAGVLQAIYQRGLHVPEDISIIGFDDTYAPFLSPPLTTVHQPVFEIGSEAARMAIGLLDGKAQAQEQIQVRTVETKLVVRSSTGMPRRYDPD